MLAIVVSVALGETEINNIDEVFFRFSTTDEKIVWFDIPMDNTFFVDFLE